MQGDTDQIRRAWDDRSARLGMTKRAVLFKRFPGWLNERIHRSHVSFIDSQFPEGGRRVLDVGCGYGRISAALAAKRPGLEFQGIDICADFAREYERSIGPCFNGPVQAYRSHDRFDCILIVTTLMYLTAADRRAVLEALWSKVDTGGSIICIEPASEMFLLWRRLTGRQSASPTGGDVAHFRMAELQQLLLALPGSRLAGARSFKAVAHVEATTVHHAVAVARDDRPAA